MHCLSDMCSAVMLQQPEGVPNWQLNMAVPQPLLIVLQPRRQPFILQLYWLII